MAYRPGRRRFFRTKIKEAHKKMRQSRQRIAETARRFGIASLVGICLVFAIALALAKEPGAIIAATVLGVTGLFAYAVFGNSQEQRNTTAARQESQRPNHTPPLQMRTPKIPPQSPATRDKDKKLAGRLFQAFQRTGLPPLLKLKNGHTLYFREPSDRYRSRADGSLEFVEHGSVLITDHEVIFQAQGNHAHSLTRLSRISYSPSDITIAEGSGRDVYRMAKPVTAFVCLICLFKMAKVAPPTEEQRVRDLLTALT